MKKILTVVIAITLMLCACLGLTACGKSKVVKNGEKIIVGITDYKPMDYKNDNGEWVGFDYELATKVFTTLGYTVEFKEIDWDTKTVTLNSGKIDCIWNGMTVTDELLENVLLSNVYLENQQVVVVKKEKKADFATQANLAGKVVAVESGSAAEGAVEDLNCKEVRKATNQNAAVLEVFAGTADCAVIDFALAKTLTSSGSDYFDKLVMVDVGFEKEEFAVAFRQSDSKLCFNVNKQINKLYKDGTILALATEYGILNQIVL